MSIILAKDFSIGTATKKFLTHLTVMPVAKLWSSYYCNKIFSHVIFKSANVGKLKDIVWYALKDLPVGQCCYGACLLMAKIYFSSGKKIEALSKMAGDTPFKAAILQKETTGEAFLGPEKADLKGSQKRCPIDEVLGHVDQMHDGVYCFHFPASGGDFHAILMIKEPQATYFYDPNLAFGKEKNAKGFLSRLFDCYQTQKSKRWIIVQDLR